MTEAASDPDIATAVATARASNPRMAVAVANMLFRHRSLDRDKALQEITFAAMTAALLDGWSAEDTFEVYEVEFRRQAQGRLDALVAASRAPGGNA